MPIFEAIGEVEELYCLRGTDGSSRGCAFVVYADEFLAHLAVDTLDGKIQLMGDTRGRPLVVRFADAPRIRVQNGAQVGAH